MTFETILKSNPAHLASLAQLFSPFNDNIALYGDGTHGNPQRAVSKHNLWGGRGDDDQAARAFVVSADEKQFAIANLGYSSITLGGKKFFEGGFIAHHAYNDAENSYTHAALETVFKDYARTVGDNDLAPGFIYTVAPLNPLYNQMQRVLTEFNHSEVTTSRIQNCFEQVLLADSARFTLVDGQIHENGKPYTVFFDIYDLDSCPELLVPQEETVKDEI